MNVLQIFEWIIWITVFILLLVNKKAFNQANVKLPKKTWIGIVIPVVLIWVLFLLYITSIYITAYHPDYEYEKTSQKVGFHIYQPTFFPNGQQLNSKFYIYDKPNVENRNSVRSIYEVPLLRVLDGDKSYIFIITQTLVETNFDILKYISSQVDIKALKINKVPVAIWKDQPAYTVTNNKGLTTAIYALSPDNVLITIGSMTQTAQNLIDIVNSLH